MSIHDGSENSGSSPISRRAMLGATAVGAAVAAAVYTPAAAEPTTKAAPGDAQEIGRALYPRSQAEIDEKVTPVNFQFPVGHVDRYGTNKHPGTTDMTKAIQTAVNVLNNWDDVNNVSISKSVFGADTQQGGYVQFGPGMYAISDTIRLAPNVYLLGYGSGTMETIRDDTDNGQGTVPEVSPGGGSGTAVTMIVALPSFPRTQYMVDSATWRFNDNSGTPVKPYRIVAYDDYMNVSLNTTASIAIANCGIRNITINGNQIAFGGYRAQGIYYSNSYGFNIYGCEYIGICFYNGFEHSIGGGSISAPIGLYVDRHESFIQYGSELSLYSFVSDSWKSANQSTITAALYSTDSSFNKLAGGWQGLTSYEVLIQCPQATFETFGGNNGNVGFGVFGRVNIGHWENEYTGEPGVPGPNSALFLLYGSTSDVICRGLSTKCQCPLATGFPNSRVVIYGPQFITPSAGLTFTPYDGEDTSTMTVEIYDPIFQDQIIGADVLDCSVINQTHVYGTVLAAAGSSDTPYQLQVDPGGNPASAGIGGIIGTIDSALTFIENNPHVQMWEILLTGEKHTISKAHTITNTTVQFSVKSGDPILSASVAPIFVNSTVVLGKITCSGWTSKAMLMGVGSLQIQSPLSTGHVTISVPDGLDFVGVGDFGDNEAACDIVCAIGGAAITFGSGSGWIYVPPNAGHACTYRDGFEKGFGSVTGTPMVEASASDSLKVISSNLVPCASFGKAAGTSSPQTVDHGLVGTPAYVSITPQNPSTAGVPYVDTITATSFNINFSGGNPFSWEAKLAQGI